MKYLESPLARAMKLSLCQLPSNDKYSMFLCINDDINYDLFILLPDNRQKDPSGFCGFHKLSEHPRWCREVHRTDIYGVLVRQAAWCFQTSSNHGNELFEEISKEFLWPVVRSEDTGM